MDYALVFLFNIMSSTNRILSLDVFRGLTIVLMILVNSQSSASYPILLHADWNGFTLADLVFPSFLFIVGLTSVISLRKHLTTEKRSAVYLSIIKRSIILFLLGLFLNIFPWKTDLFNLRIYGVLQRIALCYFVCALIYLNTTIKTQVVLFIFILIGYWLLLTQVPVPGFGAGQLTPEGTWVSYFDQILFSSSRLYEKTYDPEGFLSTFPAIATTLFGVIIGPIVLNNKNTQEKKCLIMILIGILALIGGGLWGLYFPINKDLWTSSYVLWSGGISLLLFSLCYAMIDLWNYQKWSFPFKVFGMNALFIFVVHVLLLKIQFFIEISAREGTIIKLKNAILNSVFTPYFYPANALLFYSLSFLIVNYLIALFLYKRRIFIRL